MKFSNKSVSHSFRDALARALPGLDGRADYWRLTQHLLFGTWRDLDTSRLLLPSELIAAIEGKKHDKNYVAAKFLDAYRRDVLHFEIAPHVFSFDPNQCRARSVMSLKLPEAVSALAEVERRGLPPERVWMSTGDIVLRKHTVASRQEDRAEAQGRAHGDGVCPQARLLLNYMNSLPPNRFTSALSHLPEATVAAEGLADAKNQLNLLRAVQDYAQPFYVPADKTTRIFSLRESILRLHRSLRKIMTQDWVTADLRSAQLAIVANVWGVPRLTEYLEAGRSIWPDLCGHMGLPYTDENKAIVKGALYAVTFGAGEKKMIDYLGRHFGNGCGAHRTFKAHPVIGALLQARARQLRKIRHEGGGVDAFGNVLELERYEREGYAYTFDNSRSILSCIAQSYELALLLPVVKLAASQQFEVHGFTLTTWLHDGFTFDTHRERDVGRWKQKLAEVVAEEAASLGIHTDLEFSE